MVQYFGQGCNYFWNVYSSKIDIDNLSNYIIVYLNNLLEIIWSINPMGLHNILQNLKGYNTMNLVQKTANFLQHWVSIRHKNFYTWIMFGWCQLPNNYPSYEFYTTTQENCTGQVDPKSPLL